MIRVLATPLLVVVLGAAAVACSSNDEDKPAVCSSIDDLEASFDNLRDVKVDQGGVDELRTDLATVKGDLQQVADDAADEYADEVAQVRAAYSALETSVTTAAGSPSASTLAAVSAALSTLANQIGTFVEEVGSTC